MKEIIEAAQEENIGKDLIEMGIWKREDFAEHAQDADNEESEDDWSIKTFDDDKDDDDDDDGGNDSQETSNEQEIKHLCSVTPEEIEGENEKLFLPHRVELPVGDTPDILSVLSSSSFSSEESIPTIFASDFDEYESDVFGSRLQCSIFFLPPSLKSEAGDSDMFYCVPNVAHQSSTEFERIHAKKTSISERQKPKKMRKRRELDNEFLKSAMKKYAVQDKAIKNFGNATKAFRLRMTKLGKNPKEIDDKVNAKIERKLRRRLRREKLTKRAELTKKNVRKLPNITKKAKIMNWIKIGQKNKPAKVVHKNGWTGDSEASLIRKIGNSLKKEDTCNGLQKNDEMRKKRWIGIDSADKYEVERNEGLKIGKERVRENENSTDYEKKKERTKKKKRKRRRKKSSDVRESSEESILILKDWQITMKTDQLIFENEDDDQTPRSDNSSCKGEKSTDSDEASVFARSTPTQLYQKKRCETPESEPEVIEETENVVQDEKRAKKHSTGSRWSLIKPGNISDLIQYSST